MGKPNLFGGKGTSSLIATLACLSMGSLTQAISALSDQFWRRQELSAPDGNCGLPINQGSLLCRTGRSRSEVVDGAPVIADASVQDSEMDADLISIEEPTSQTKAPKSEGERRSIGRLQAGISFGTVLHGTVGKQAPVFSDSEASRTMLSMALYRSPDTPGYKDPP